MALLPWIASYSVGVPVIDAQHKHLIGLINELHDQMLAGRGKDILSSVLDRLVQYTNSHFADEERAMVTAAYPRFEEHRAEHDSLTQRVARLQKDVRDGKVAVTMEVMTFLKEWLHSHILGSDKQYCPWLSRLPG